MRALDSIVMVAKRLKFPLEFLMNNKSIGNILIVYVLVGLFEYSLFWLKLPHREISCARVLIMHFKKCYFVAAACLL